MHVSATGITRRRLRCWFAGVWIATLSSYPSRSVNRESLKMLTSLTSNSHQKTSSQWYIQAHLEKLFTVVYTCVCVPWYYAEWIEEWRISSGMEPTSLALGAITFGDTLWKHDWVWMCFIKEVCIIISDCGSQYWWCEWNSLQLGVSSTWTSAIPQCTCQFFAAKGEKCQNSNQ